MMILNNILNKVKTITISNSGIEHDGQYVKFEHHKIVIGIMWFLGLVIGGIIGFLIAKGI